jgi:ATP-dependent helicase HrpB
MLREGATLAALMSEKDILRWEKNQSKDSLAAGAGRVMGSSDLLLRLEIIESRGHDPRVDPTALRQVLRVRDELLRVGERIARPPASSAIAANTTSHKNPPAAVEDTEAQLRKLILYAYPDRVCRRRGAADRAVMVGGGGIKLGPDSIVRQSDFFVAVDARQDERSTAREAFVRIASAIDVAWLEELFPAQIRRQRSVIYDETRQRVVGQSQIWYRDLLLREDKDAPVDAQQATDALGAILRQRGGDIFRADESAEAVLARVALLREKMPEKSWPAWNDEELGELLVNAAAHQKSLGAVKALPLASILKSSLVYPLDRLLVQEAPQEMEVPSGSRIQLRYAASGEVILAARLQELFGWQDTPRIAGGRVPIKLELLGPNYRPVQVTSDLKSFWSTTYFQVRKDLKARYPKHAWPEDPLTAKAEAKGRKRK